MSKRVAITMMSLLAMSIAGLARGQDPTDAELRALERTQPELEQAELDRLREREAAAAAGERARQQAEQDRIAQQDVAAALAGREAALEQARRQLEDARAQLERAAREIARGTGPGGDAAYVFLRDGNIAFGSQRGQLGAQLVESDRGALVTRVLPGTAAEDAGLAAGDVIQSIDGISLAGDRDASVRSLRERLGELDTGATVGLVVERAGETRDLEIELDDNAPGSVFMPFPQAFPPQVVQSDIRVLSGGDGEFIVSNLPRTPAPAAQPETARSAARGLQLLRTLSFANSPWGDMELVSMTESLGRYFDTSEGLLVVSGPEDDAIDIRDGDVILAINGRTPNSPEHAIRILSSFESGETIEFSIMRDRRRQAVTYSVPEIADPPGVFDFELERVQPVPDTP